MRKIEYLSPSSISQFYSDLDEFYLNYLIEERPPRPPQTKPMSIGSGFDARVKSFLHEKLFGKGNDPKFEFTNIFEAQVESHNRDWALGESEYLFEEYRRLGVLADLLIDLQSAIGTPRFEFNVMGAVSGYREGVTKEVSGLILLGKPDIFYVNKNGLYIILDFKVNGYLSNYKTSPHKGYVRMRPGGQQHKDAVLIIEKGQVINVAHNLEDLDESWAQQLSIYAWLCGCNVGENFVVAIDQICGNRGSIRIAEHRMKVSSKFQYQILGNAQAVWDIVHSDWIFRDLTKEHSIEKCKMLDKTAKLLRGENGTIEDKWFAQCMRG